MNRLPGIVTGVTSHDGLALIDVDVSGVACSAMLVGGDGQAAPYAPGEPVMLGFKEFEVSLARDLQGAISLRNRLPCRVTALQSGQVMSRVLLDFNGHALSAVITSRSVAKLCLAVGDTVEALIKANEMNLIRHE